VWDRDQEDAVVTLPQLVRLPVELDDDAALEHEEALFVRVDVRVDAAAGLEPNEPEPRVHCAGRRADECGATVAVRVSFVARRELERDVLDLRDVVQTWLLSVRPDGRARLVHGLAEGRT
jgi:hypothetical protein